MEIRRDRFCRIFLCPFSDVRAVEGLICMHNCEIYLANFIGQENSFSKHIYCGKQKWESHKAAPLQV